jgi:hypothetical protein
VIHLTLSERAALCVQQMKGDVLILGGGVETERE